MREYHYLLQAQVFASPFFDRVVLVLARAMAIDANIYHILLHVGVPAHVAPLSQMP